MGRRRRTGLLGPRLGGSGGATHAPLVVGRIATGGAADLVSRSAAGVAQEEVAVLFEDRREGQRLGAGPFGSGGEAGPTGSGQLRRQGQTQLIHLPREQQ